MSSSGNHAKSGPVAFLFENSLFLVFGAVAALVWANVDQHSYHNFVHFDLKQVIADRHGADSHGHAEPSASDEHADDERAGETNGDDEGSHDADDSHDGEHAAGADAGEHDSGGHGNASGGLRWPHLTVHFLINDILMALFFAIAGKEVWESMLPGGALSNPRKAATPLLATLGGVVGPAALYLAGALAVGQTGWFGQPGNLGRGWAIPCATDIAFSYLVARMIFGQGHPAIAFLLLLAIADDAAGLVILAIAYPQGAMQPAWFLLTAAAVALCFVFRKMRIQSFWAYLLIPGVMSWFSFQFAGVHAALGLVPIIPVLPHAHTDLGIFARKELDRHDTLNEFEHWWKNPVEIILGLFGLANAGVTFSSVGAGTLLVLFGLVVGKPLGITLLTWIAQKILRLEIPAGMGYRHIVTLGMVAGIGFTVALFVSEAAYPSSNAAYEGVRDAVKMGALASFGAGVLAIALGRALGIRPTGAEEESQLEGDAAPVAEG